MRSKPTKLQQVCHRCGTSFFTWPFKVRAGEGRFCSVKCTRSAISPEVRFWSYVNKTDECWLWTGPTSRRGYGRFSIGPRNAARPIVASRFSYELHYGPIPDDALICHRCDNPACVRPDHLFAGTHQDNMSDMAAKGRSPRGEQSPRAKLTADTVRAIRFQHGAGVSGYALARQYGMSYTTVKDLLRGRTWKQEP